MSDRTVDPALRTWVDVPDGSDFPIQNLPFGVFRTASRGPRVGVAIGEHIVDMAELAGRGILDEAGAPGSVFESPSLNAFLDLGDEAWAAVRTLLSRWLSADGPPGGADAVMVPMREAEMLLPIAVGDYVDFYSSIDHATNVGKIFRPNESALPPNWRHLPIGYHGRASTIVADGTAVRRPAGQRPRPGGPDFGPSEKLDIELEVGFVTGPGPAGGEPIPVEAAERYIFGLCLVNDWSARGLQAWEYRPLGPFLGKSFATTVSPWIVPLAALQPFRVPAPAQDPPPLPYLASEDRRGIDLALEVDLNGTTIVQTNFAGMYWTMAQQLAHASSNGTLVRSGDLYASGTVSGPEPASVGSLLELSWNGTRPIEVAGSGPRTFLENGDIVTLRGWCEGDDAVRIGFGSCSGTILPGHHA